jgi:hypothetical protein
MSNRLTTVAIAVSVLLFAMMLDQGWALHQLADQNEILNDTTTNYYNTIQELTKDVEDDEWIIKDLHKKIDVLEDDKESLKERVLYAGKFIDLIDTCETNYCRNSCTGHMHLYIRDLRKK